MKIGAINNRRISFGRALTSSELTDYRETLTQAKKIAGNDGKSILIVHDACLPQNLGNNTGVGNLSAKKSLEFFDFMHNYLNINAIEVLPPGEIRPLKDGQFYCAYSSSAFSLSPHHINLEALTTPKYGSLISQKDVSEVVQNNKIDDKDMVVNYENVVKKDSAADQALRKYFLKFQSASNVKDLQKAFETYKKENADWLEPKVIFNALSQEYGHDKWQEWDEFDKNLMSNNSKEAQERRRVVTAKRYQDSEFYRFKQFMADTHLSEARKNINSRGMKLIGDCLVNFSPDEIWANQKAFDLSTTIGWNVPAFDYSNIENPNSEAAKLLKKKVQMFAKRYDSIRFDVSWSYVQPVLYSHNGKNKGPDFGDRLLTQIEKHVKEVKGETFDTHDLIHEFDASPDDFELVRKYDKKYLFRDSIQDRTKAMGTTYMSETWGNNFHYLELNKHQRNFILGAGNHDPQPLRQIAEGIPDNDGRIYKTDNIKYLSKLFGTRPEKLQDPVEFTRAKFAEITTAKHNQYFYIDVFGEKRRFDSQYKNGYANYRQKIPSDFQSHYFKALEEGFAFNPMDALARVFKLRGLDRINPELYERMIKYRDILMEKTKAIVEPPKKSKNPAAVAIVGIVGALTGGYALINSKSKK